LISFDRRATGLGLLDCFRLAFVSERTTDRIDALDRVQLHKEVVEKANHVNVARELRHHFIVVTINMNVPAAFGESLSNPPDISKL
jgi:hypothetical protein